jgi:hypothetical protein
VVDVLADPGAGRAAQRHRDTDGGARLAGAGAARPRRPLRHRSRPAGARHRRGSGAEALL